MFGYLYGYTVAQIELMVVDQPIVVYDKKKDKKSKGKKEKFSSPSKEAMENALQRYKEMQKKKAESTNANNT